LVETVKNALVDGNTDQGILLPLADSWPSSPG
jgi:hypothetical protein